MPNQSFKYVCILLLVLSTIGSFGQVSTGTPAFGSFGGGPFDTINLGNLNVHFNIPVFSRAGRGIPFSYALNYDSSVWTVSGTSWQPVSNWGWKAQTELLLGYISFSTSQTKCFDDLGWYYVNRYTNWKYHDNFGVVHSFVLSPAPEDCDTNPGTWTGTVDGITLDASAGTVKLPSGQTITPPQNTGAGSGTATDENGNYISTSGTTITDTLGTTALTISGSPNPTTFQYTGPNGALQSVALTYTNKNVHTYFQCTGITEYTATNVPLITKIAMPDDATNSDHYTITYEASPDPNYPGYVTGRIASITLPTGGTITYTYNNGSNDGASCSDGSSLYLKKQTPDTGSSYWLYSRSNISGTNWQTTITDPSTSANQAVLNFQAVTDGNGVTNFYETKRLVYTGSSGTGTLLSTKDTCYNGGAPDSGGSCTSNTFSIPVTQVDQYRRLPSKTGGPNALTTTKYDATYQRVTEVDEYDFGAKTSGAVGSLLRETTSSYASLGNGIVNRPSQVSVYDGGGSLKAQTTYSYDTAGLTAPGGTTPHHNAVSGSRGNVTQISYLVAGSTTLSKNFTYYDTGGLHTATDLGGTHTTTYQLGASTTANCGNSFPVEIDQPLSLTTYLSWACAQVGSSLVRDSVTDPNGQLTSTTYYDSGKTPSYDAFWRPIYSSDASSNTTYFTYTTMSAESKLTFNSNNSVIDQLSTVDILGRVHVAQQRQGPSSSYYDSVETDYDRLGRAYRATLPYQQTAGQPAGSPQYTTTSFDGAGRATQVTDAKGGYTATAYNNGSTSYYNDVLVTLGPLTSGEALKKRQMEYDALGRLTSVCEITTLTGNGTCSQNVAQTGYWTQYSYNVLDQIVSVTQNAQGTTHQTRSFSYDGLGRLTSETNPETGTTSYVYDSDGTCGSSSGDLVKRTDAIAPTHNVTCYAYDAMHRITARTYASGSYASVTPETHFVYDSATVNGVAMANAKGRMAEAYTGSSGAKITDLGFSYSVRGENMDVYQKSPNSGGYYHVTAAYWEHGALKTLSNIPSVATLTWNMDGEGRVTSVTGGTTSPVTSTAYDDATGTLLRVAFGSTVSGNDVDSFAYDGSTLRITTYQYSVGGVNDIGQFTWNTNGTLQQAVFTDSLSGSLDSQTCNYTHDDLARIKKVDCGTKWEQDFAPDAFGNLYKTTTGNGQVFTPGYNPATNQISSGYSVSYDENGNLKNDGITPQQYTWDAENRPHTLSVGTTVTVVYDALGRAVENQSGTNQEILYAPGIGKVALMNGASLVKAWVPLPGGGKAVYTSTGLTYYQHGDWLGSSRLTSKPDRTTYFEGAYAPFGEDYAENGTNDLSFTGQTQDTLPGKLYDFLYRRYHPVQGRWISPDPAARAAVNPANPQTWNRYAYLSGNPASATDVSGLADCREAKHCPANGGGRQYHSASACIDDYCPVGEMGVTAMGYDIFDAVEGPPGTYISYDSGQMSFGFSQSLWASTQTFIEWGNAILKTGLSNRDRQPQWQPKFRVDIDELGIYNSISGIVPELEQLQLEQSRLINSLPSDFRNELVLTINHPRLWGPLWETAMNPCEQGETLYCGHPELQREESYWRVLQNEWKNWLSELPALFSKP